MNLGHNWCVLTVATLNPKSYFGGVEKFVSQAGLPAKSGDDAHQNL